MKTEAEIRARVEELRTILKDPSSVPYDEWVAAQAQHHILRRFVLGDPPVGE
jgi:predicted Zn-dependent peptidase